jgi:hypothetical protein
MMRLTGPVQFGALYKFSLRKIYSDIQPAERTLNKAGITHIDNETAQKIALYGATGDEDFILGNYKDVFDDSQNAFVATSTDVQAFERLNQEIPDSDTNKKQKVLRQLIGLAASYGRYRELDTFPSIKSWDIE